MTTPNAELEGRQAIIEAVTTGNTGRVAKLLEANPALAGVRGRNGESLVLLATYYGRGAVARLLIQRGVELDVFDAAAAGQFTRVSALLNDRPEMVDAVAPDGFTPLGLAAFFGHPMIVRALLDRGATADMPSQNQLHVTPLNSAAAARQVEIAELLLKHGADPNTPQQDSFTPLHAAAQNGQVEMAELLLRHGANVNPRAAGGQTPLGMALKEGHKAVADLLRGHGGTE